MYMLVLCIYLITWMLICDHWFHACHYMAIFRQKREGFGEIKKIKKIETKEFYIKIVYQCPLSFFA